MSPDRGYNPPESNLQHLIDMHAQIGVERVVFTQPSIYGTDNSAILDACDELNANGADRARCVVAVGTDVTDVQLHDMHTRGSRGVRLNSDNEGGMLIQWADLPRLCEQIAPLGWHIELLIPGKDIVELAPMIASLKVPVSMGHFAYQPAAAGVTAEGFKVLLELLRQGSTWLKISGADRVSSTGSPDYEDVAPLAEAVLTTAPDRLMWGTDWPHPNKYEDSAMPDEGDLVNCLHNWTHDPQLRHKILIETPQTFYDFTPL